MKRKKQNVRRQLQKANQVIRELMFYVGGNEQCKYCKYENDETAGCVTDCEVTDREMEWCEEHAEWNGEINREIDDIED